MSTSVLVLDKYADTYAGYLRASFPDLVVHQALAMEHLSVDLAQIDILVAFGIAINNELIERLASLKWIQSLATGVDHFLRCPALRPETLLTSARGIHGAAMRETVAYLMLSLSQESRRLARNQTEHRWDRSQPWSLLAGKTAVIVGVGLSSVAIAKLLAALGMNVVGVSGAPRLSEGFDCIVPRSELVEIAGEAVYLINVLPADPANIGLISRSVIDAMKPSGFLVNVGRGETLDEDALIDALREQRIAGAGLDVFRNEPLPADSPIWDLPNVFLTPHLGGFFREYEEYMKPLLVENMRLFLGGRYGEMRNRISHGKEQS